MMSFPSRAVWPLAFVMISTLACQAPTTQEPTAAQGADMTISGHLLTSTGEAPTLGHVHVGPPLGRGLDTGTVVEVADDGSFQLTVDRGAMHGMRRIALSALHHESAVIPLVVGADTDQIEIEVTLQAREIPEGVSAIRIEGDLNAEMERRDDGTWAHTVGEPGELEYRLRASDSSLRFDGTQADRYEPYWNGYGAVIEANPGTIDIVYDPSQLPPQGDEDLPRLSTRHTSLAQAFSLKNAYEKAYAAMRQAMKSGDENLDYGDFYRATRDLAIETLDSGDSVELHDYAAAQILSIPGTLVTAEEEQRALAQLSTDSPFWNLVGVLGLDSDTHGELLDSLRSHPDTTVSAMALAALVRGARSSNDMERWQSLYAELERVDLEAMGSSGGIIESLLMRYDPHSRIATGKPVPEFDLTLFESSFDGQDTISNADLLGHVYLLDFWGPWCSPCVADLPHIRDVLEAYGPRGFQVLSLAVDHSPEVIREFMDEQPMPWLHHFVEGGFDGEILETFEVSGYPRPILVGADGNIVTTRELRGEDLMGTVGKALGESDI